MGKRDYARYVSTDKNVILGHLVCLLACSVTGRSARSPWPLRCFRRHTILAKSHGSVRGHEDPKRDKRVRRPAPTSLLAPRGHPLRWRFHSVQPYYQDGSNLRVPVNPRLVVSPAICRCDRYHYAKRAEGPILALGSVGGVYKLGCRGGQRWDEKRLQGECGAHVSIWCATSSAR